MRDFRSLPPSKLRKRELRALIAVMRLREARMVSMLFAELPPERALELASELVAADPLDKEWNGS